MNDRRVRMNLETAVKQVASCIPRPTAKPPWQEMEERTLWHELVACLLGSRVRFEHALSATARLQKLGLLDPATYGGNLSSLESRLVDALSTPIGGPAVSGFLCQRYPYPRLRANHVKRTAENLYARGGSLCDLLHTCATPSLARKRLTAVAVGIGPKQASLFLRNIGYSDELAVLDVHVLRYMGLIGLIPKPIITVQGIHRYEKLERVLLGYASTLQANPAFLDIAIWVVMRVYRREAN
jgi:N-glycosylase/DNA lyase